METERTDIRKLEPAACEQLRRTVIHMHKRGHTQTAIAQKLGLRRPTVTGWIVQANAGRGVKEAQRGRPLGEGRKLTPAQEERIRKDIVDNTPDPLKLRFALWSAQAVRALIKAYFGIDLTVRSVRNYLKRWGFTPQRPLKRAFEQKPEAVQKWLAEEYPAIAARAKAEGAEICWGDETAVSSVEHYPRGYAPKGKTPVLVLSQAKRERINLISAITNQGTMRFMMYRDTLTAEVLIKFFDRLSREADRKVFLVLDNLRVHHSRKVREWLADKLDKIELFFLPSDSPELNPDEYLNADLKARMSAAEPVRDAAHLKRKVLSHLRSIQKQPARIRSYFKADRIKYAA
ncbi:IS630 family transposase [Methylococcus geothermalis]|uniref:IS630 family transposase n=1 Tax=Methylococcus geothermalis TaxID=2681310 RepID=A0A858QAD5_9GAMM|nr:IS630 family transposase [Methylococcus geothermalis]QJD30800.1 IS630 family transposase [Methylococcus geothermalis]